MILNIFKKDEKPAQTKKTDLNQGQINFIKTVLNRFPIGKRFRYFVEPKKDTLMESLIIGYRINGEFIYHQGNIEFSNAENILEPHIAINRQDDTMVVTHLESLEFIIPSDIGEELKLDYDSRANLGTRGQFGSRNTLALVSLHNGSKNMRVNGEVHRKTKLKSGIHSGHLAVLLNIDLNSFEPLEPREKPRVETKINATIKKNEQVSLLDAFILDIAEFTLRAGLNPATRTWPIFGKDDYAVITFKPANDKSAIQCRCSYIRESGCERAFKIEQIYRRGEFVAFEIIDAMELVMDTMSNPFPDADIKTFDDIEVSDSNYIAPE